jgi:hypothetical protein
MEGGGKEVVSSLCATCHRPSLVEWQVFDAIGKVFRYANQAEDFQVTDALSNSDLELMRVDDACKRLSAFLPLGRFPEQVCIAGEQDALENHSTIQ